MTLFRYSILAVTLAASMGSAGIVHAADSNKDDDDRPGVRRCTNDPNMASDLYEYLEKCPAAQGVLNQAGQWEAARAGAAADTVKTPSTAGQGSSMTTPSAPRGTGIGTPSATGGSSMGNPSAPSGGGATKGN